jgi:hypothetical protein
LKRILSRPLQIPVARANEAERAAKERA